MNTNTIRFENICRKQIQISLFGLNYSNTELFAHLCLAFIESEINPTCTLWSRCSKQKPSHSHGAFMYTLLFYQILKKSCQTKGKQVGLEIVTKRWEEENKGLGGSALRTIWERFRAIKGCKVFEEAPLLFQELSTCKSPKCATNPNVLWVNRRNQRELQTWEWLRCQF